MSLHKKLSQRLIDALNKAKTYTAPILSTALIILSIFVVYWRDLEILANEAINAEALSYILLIPFFIGYLFYQKKDLVKASLALEKLTKQSKTKYLDELIGLSLCLMAFLLYWYGSYTFYSLEYHLLSLPLFIAGLVLALFNFNTLKILSIPILFLIFLVPLPNEIMYTLGGTLANFNTQASYVLLKAFGFPVTLSTSYGAPTINLATSTEPIPFTIDLACSGIYTLIAFTMFAAFLAIIISASSWKKIVIFPLGFLIFVVLNILRITTLISAAVFFGEEIAMNIFHTVAGLLLIFIGMMLTLFMSEKFLKIKIVSKTNNMPPCSRCKTNRETLGSFCSNCGRFINPLKKLPNFFWAKLILLLLGFSIISLSVNAPVFAIANQTIEVSSTWEKATNILPQIPQYKLTCIGRDVRYEQLSKQDASITYVYIPTNISTPVIYVLIGVAGSLSNLHSWEVCLITWQTAQGQYPLVEVLDSRDIQLLGESIIARYLVFKDIDQNYTQVTLYWYERATFKIGATIQQKYVRISLIIILTKDQANYQQNENFLLDFGQEIAHYWEPIKNQSLISLGVFAQQMLLVILIAFIVTTKTTQYINEWRKRTNNLKIFNNFASPKDKLVLQTTVELSKEKKTVTTEDINLAIRSKVGKFMKLESLIEHLNRLQEYGFIKREIVSNHNKPLLSWKSLINV
jgi:exosortase